MTKRDDMKRIVILFSMSMNNQINDQDEEEQQQRARSSKRLPAHEVSMEEYNDLSKRLDAMETSVDSILNKVKDYQIISSIN